MIHDYDYLEKIVLVDNHSTDDSWEQLQVLKDEKVELIRTGKMAVMATATIQGSAMPSSTTELPCAGGKPGRSIFRKLCDPHGQSSWQSSGRRCGDSLDSG